jgi:dCTP deaminase
MAMPIARKTKFHTKVMRSNLVIEPYDLENLTECGYNLHIGDTLYRLKGDSLDITEKQDYTKRALGKSGVVLKPGELYLVKTQECLFLSSVLGYIIPLQDAMRKGIFTQGSTVDVGYKGHLLIPVTVAKPIKIYPGIPFIKFKIEEDQTAETRTRSEYNEDYDQPLTEEY